MNDLAAPTKTLLTLAQLRVARVSLVNQKLMYEQTGGGPGVLAALDKAIQRHDAQIAHLQDPAAMRAAREQIATLEKQLREVERDE